MTYGLGVDLGTTFTAAAISRGDRLDMVTLGDRSAAIPSVVMVRDDGTSLVGDAAHRRAAADPSRVAREVKRRLGDPTPLILGGEPHSAAGILSRLLRSVVDAVGEREGGRPDGIVLTHPANWGPYKRELFDSVPRLADLSAVSMVTEPEAAAAHYASTARVPVGSVVAVYDLGGGTFDATVLRQLDEGFEFLGPPEGIEGLGGIDFDEAVFAHVDRSVEGALSELDLDDPQAAAALVRVRQDCVLAKEALSADTETSVPVMLPGLHTEVRLTRAEFEEMIGAPIESTVSALRRALAAAEVGPEDLSNVLLVGGSSRIPLVSRMLSAELGRPTAIDTHPKHAVALGAALLAERRRAAAPTPRPPGSPQRGTGAPTPAHGSPRRGAAAPVAAALAGGAAAATPSWTSAGPRPDPSPHSGLLPVVGPGSGSLPTMRHPSGGVPIQPPPGGFRPAPSRGPDGPGHGGGHWPTGPFPQASAAGSAPPALGTTTAAAAAATRRRRVRIAVVCAAVALVLGAGGVATAAALTDRTGLPAVAPSSPSPAAAVPTETTAAPVETQSEAPVAHAPAAVQPAGSPATHGDSGGRSHDRPTSTNPTTTTRSSTSSSGHDGSGTGSGSGTGTGSGGGDGGTGNGGGSGNG